MNLNSFTLFRLFLSLGFVGISAQSFAAPVPAETKTFIETQLQTVPKVQYLWVSSDLKQQSIELLGHAYFKIRIPYWQEDSTDNQKTAKTIWVLDEIGKEKPITVGIVIQNSQIVSLRILAFRESRGWEVKLPSFTQQFDKIHLKSGPTSGRFELSRSIDGISGATLSVRAVTKLSKLALLLQAQIDLKSAKL
jgi:Na+-translocating ferredoxin:NAD+ oxidoreductase RnfG subunit